MDVIISLLVFCLSLHIFVTLGSAIAKKIDYGNDLPKVHFGNWR